MKVGFLDRDGTIIEDYEDKLWSSITEPVFINGAIDALKAIRQRGYEIIIITNQYLINEKIITLERYKEITDKFIKILLDNGVEILDIFYCPHSKEENCNCMKPKDGMIKMALEKYSKIDMENSFIAGDSLCDIQLGERLGIKAFGIGLDKEEGRTIKIDALKDIVRYL
ncbi:HAD-IIIA family hydrolase [Tissierella pigra]|uniref:D,D-heptose 1,7-bisphosphate phosphatase n=1 Tax=Tissierella pigra TaxID=2607614 RepID=A0A6N7XE55_9FIRM|nr:HAD-IIIA family hydrolase [Tissierella pigra]MBU5427580.1 HAD-IIIA family hydrolase [Tissierella pigra]MSU00329.1 HAD-IIIA family hydrolase [Tissierella pigra]